MHEGLLPWLFLDLLRVGLAVNKSKSTLIPTIRMTVLVSSFGSCLGFQEGW